MQNIVIDKPYRFIPPLDSRWWPRVLCLYAPHYLNRKHGITQIECVGLEHLKESIAAGHGVLLTPNHCRDCDPFMLYPLIGQMGRPLWLMASWHIFMQSRMQTFLLRRAGAFSIYREGMDRLAINAATEILEAGRRPLVVFPEGVVSRTNDHLNSLMEGTGLIARAAAKRRAKANPEGKVVVHPVAIRYRFAGDLEATLGPVLDRIELRLTWRPQTHLSLVERIYKLGFALLSLKEIEFIGKAQEGPIHERLRRLIDHLLEPLEREWLNHRREDSTVARVKRLRIAILPDLVKGDLPEEERERRWRQLADVYLAQQLSHYPPDYIRSNPTPERLLETVERFEEDMTDVSPIHGPLRARVTVGAAIPVAPDSEDLMLTIEQELKRLLGISQGGVADVSA